MKRNELVNWYIDTIENNELDVEKEENTFLMLLSHLVAMVCTI